MAVLDWIVAILMVVSLVVGAWRGLVYEVLSALSWLVAFLVAPWLAPSVAAWLPLMQEMAEALRYAVAFVLVFVGVLFAGGLVAWLCKKLVEAVGLRPMDRALGAAFGVVRGGVVVLALAVVVHLASLQRQAWWTESVTAGVATAALRGLKPVVPEAFGRYLPD